MTISGAFVVAIIPRRKPAKKVPISGRLLLLIVPHRFEGACSGAEVGVSVIGRAYRLLGNRKCIRHYGVLWERKLLRATLMGLGFAGVRSHEAGCSRRVDAARGAILRPPDSARRHQVLPGIRCGGSGLPPLLSLVVVKPS
jgi:hypothetical protein